MLTPERGSDGRATARALRRPTELTLLDLPDGALAVYEPWSGTTHLCEGLNAVLLDALAEPAAEDAVVAEVVGAGAASPVEVAEAIQNLLDLRLLQRTR